MLPLAISAVFVIFQFVQVLSDEMASVVKPKVLVFDLDYTLWPFWVDTHVSPPFQKTPSGDIVDCNGAKISCYDEVPDVLSKLHKEGYLMSVASRTGETQGAKQLVELFGWKKYFAHEQIYPGMKIKHLMAIKQGLGVEYKDIIFFDDEGRNIRDVAEMGIMSILVENGVTKKVVDDAISQFSRRRFFGPQHNNNGHAVAGLHIGHCPFNNYCTRDSVKVLMFVSVKLLLFQFITNYILLI